MKFNSSNDNSRPQKPLSQDDQLDYGQLKDMVDECLIHLALFNSWEESFLGDMQDKLEKNQGLSDRQREIIESCHDKVVRRQRPRVR